jgi:hypothetical protein
MDELAQRIKARMAFDAAGVSATIEPGGKLTVKVDKAAIIPVTGLCTPAAEAYAGQQISYLPLADGQSITLSLADCNPDFVAAGGPGGAGGDYVPPGPTVGGNCPGTGGAGGDGGATTMDPLTTDAGTDPGAYGGGGSGCGCLLSGGVQGGAQPRPC